MRKVIRYENSERHRGTPGGMRGGFVGSGASQREWCVKSGAAASLLNGCQAYSDIHQSFPLFPPVT